MKKIPLLLPLLLTLCLSLATPTASAQHEPSLLRKADREKMNRWVDSVYNAMTDDERVGQLIMIIAEPKLDAANMRRLERYVSELKIGGVLFHTGDPGTQAEVTNRLQRAARLPLFIALDGEWGLSMRLRGTTRFPKNMMLGAVQDTRLIEDYGAEVARQCREMGIHINFAHRTFTRSNESAEQAHVFCVIVGFSYIERAEKFAWNYQKGTVEREQVKQFNGYLTDTPSVFLKQRSKPICDVPPMIRGNQPTDAGFLLMTAEEREAEKYIRKYSMGEDFIKGKERYCLWLIDCPLQKIAKMPLVRQRLLGVKGAREKSSKLGTRKKRKLHGYLMKFVIKVKGCILPFRQFLLNDASTFQVGSFTMG